MNWISPLVGEGHAYGPLTATKHVPEDYVQLMGSIFFFLSIQGHVLQVKINTLVNKAEMKSATSQMT